MQLLEIRDDELALVNDRLGIFFTATGLMQFLMVDDGKVLLDEVGPSLTPFCWPSKNSWAHCRWLWSEALSWLAMVMLILKGFYSDLFISSHPSDVKMFTSWNYIVCWITVWKRWRKNREQISVHCNSVFKHSRITWISLDHQSFMTIILYCTHIPHHISSSSSSERKSRRYIKSSSVFLPHEDFVTNYHWIECFPFLFFLSMAWRQPLSSLQITYK